VTIQDSPPRVVDQLKRFEEELSPDSQLRAPSSEKTFDLFSEHVLSKVRG